MPGAIKIGGYGELNLSVGYRQSGFSAALFVDNVTDELYYDGGSNGSDIYPDYQYGPSQPRRIGVKLGVAF